MGRSSPNGASALWNLGQSRWSQGDHDGAEALFEEAVGIRREVFRSDHHLVQASLSRLADLLGGVGRWSRARPVLEELTATRSQQLGDAHHLTARSRARLGECLAELGDFEEGEKHLLRAHATLEAITAKRPAYLAHVRKALVRLYARWGKPGLAESYRAPRRTNR